MKNNKITNLTRVALFIGGLAVFLVLFVPIWRIDLAAPQYPEGLNLLIYANKLAGNLDIINGINHYIGMKPLKSDGFIEFKILPGIFIFFAVFFIICAITARKILMNILLVLLVAFGILSMVDFWRWEYDFGHNLNPDAAIIVPGMAYQPPLIGFKQLLNFGTYSIPDIGGWILVGVGVMLLGLVIFERKIGLKSRKRGKILHVLVLAMILLPGCNTEPQPLLIGKDNCDFCRMTISDNRFGAEIVTNKGKIYRFDDPHCIVSFLNSKEIDKQEIAGVYFVDFNNPHQFIKAENAYFLQSPKLKSPMNGNIAAFIHEDSLARALPEFYGNAISWEDMQK